MFLRLENGRCIGMALVYSLRSREFGRIRVELVYFTAKDSFVGGLDSVVGF
jgi:hypothetical protein